jgi:hypothetical protein
VSQPVLKTLEQTESQTAANATYSPDVFKDALVEAEQLLKYAAESGIKVDANSRASILHARATLNQGWSEAVKAKFLQALTTVAAGLKPVTAESLRECSKNTRRTAWTYWGVAIGLSILIVPFSVASFVSTAIADAIRKDIATANELAVKINSQLEATATPASANAVQKGATVLPPGLRRDEVVTELQSFASTIRAIDSRALQLNWFLRNHVTDPFAEARGDSKKLKEKFQLTPPLLDLPSATTDRILVYQDVRTFGQGVVNDVSVFYGAITACILPVLYALLGTCAYLLRRYEQEMRNRTFVPSDADFPRFLIAGIAGAVVGLFNNFTISQEASIPPLAIAFLVGYAVDVFFLFLEGLVQTFGKDKTAVKDA